MLLGLVLLIGGIALVMWGGERFTDGALKTAAVMTVSPFYVGIVVSGFEPENLVTGVLAVIEGFPQVALGTVIGSAIFLLTAALGIALLVVPMETKVPKTGAIAMLLSAGAFLLAIWDGDVTRVEGGLLLVFAAGLLAWLYRSSAVFLKADDEEDGNAGGATSRLKAYGLLVVGVAVLVAGAECIVRGVGGLIHVLKVSETFLGMAVVGMGESLEETARMVPAARRGHADLAWGNVVGTVVILLGVNLGIIALVRPLVADALVIRFHVPYLLVCIVFVGSVLLFSKRAGRPVGLLLVGLYVIYLAVNVRHLWL